MMKLSKLCSMAVAMAMTLSIIAPISANAEVIITRDGEGENQIWTYTNEDNKNSISSKDYLIYNTSLDFLKSELKVKTIATNSYAEEVELSTTKDAVKFENFKSDKKALKVKVVSFEENTDTSDPKTCILPDYEDKEYGYYKNYNGEIVKVAKADYEKSLPVGLDNATYTLRLFTKKPGTYKVSYDVKLKTGGTVKKSFKVLAKKSADPVKLVTYAGKTVYQSKYEETSDNFLFARGYGYNATSKKSGKLRVTMNKNYKLLKIEVGTPAIEIKKEEDGSVSTEYKRWQSSLDVAEYDRFLDQQVVCTWKKVKNGKKIKLAKVDTSAVGTKYDPAITKRLSGDNNTDTYIRITYYDKKNKTTDRMIVNVELIKK